MRGRIFLPVLCPAFLCVLASCQRAKETPAGPETRGSASPAARPFRDLPGTVFDVTFTPQTVRLDEAAWRGSLKSVSLSGAAVACHGCRGSTGLLWRPAQFSG